MTAHAQPQEMSPDKTIRLRYVTVVAGQKRETKSLAPKESAESQPEANCGQHAPGRSVSRISGKVRSFGWVCSELKKFHVRGQIVPVFNTIEEELYFKNSDYHNTSGSSSIQQISVKQ